MVYTERKNLTVLELMEERDVLSYDELIPVLMERPSNVIYIELDGVLYGIVTMGHIHRTLSDKTRQVTINKHFISVRPEENAYMRSRRLFKEKDNIIFAPVVNSEGKLLGEWAKENDLSTISHMLFTANNFDVAELLKEQKLVLVRPCATFEKKQKIFLFWKEFLENKGVFLEILNCKDAAGYLLKNSGTSMPIFLDEAERQGAVGCLEMVKGSAFKPGSFTYKYFFARMEKGGISKTSRSVELFHSLQAQNITVLAFDFIENEHGYLEKFQNKVQKNYDSKNTSAIARSKQGMPDIKTVLTKDGFFNICDADTPLFHAHQGKRQTVNQPETYERCVYVVGPCLIIGLNVEDQYTLPSLLQKELNLSGFSCKVVNLGAPSVYGEVGIVKALKEDLKQGDIVVFDAYRMPVHGIQVLNLTNALEESQAPVEWFEDTPRHCNHEAYQIYAKAIYKELLPVLGQPVESRESIKKEDNIIKQLYIARYFADFDPSKYGKIGSIVMNCNPFTFGHRYLIEYAASQVDYLIIFVVEEDASLFTFEERFTMVCDGTADLKNVKVVPSGEFILSKRSFPEYFIKEADEDIEKNTENDITLFAEKIAPELGITHRFVGEEPEDQVTNTYNQAMKKILPAHGIELVEIPRKQDGKAIISASRVRKCLENNDLKSLDVLVPESTKKIMFYVNE